MATNKNRFTTFAVIALVLVSGFLLVQGFSSAYRFYPGLPGYQVQAFDATPGWIAARAFFFEGLDPYSPAAVARIQTAYFGRPLEAADKNSSLDEHRFAYPLYATIFFLPTIFFDFSTALLLLWLCLYSSFVFGVLLWFRLLQFPVGGWAQILVLAVLLALPEAYIAFQTRQPSVWVFFIISAGIYFASRATPFTDVLAGFLLAWSTIKPQSSLLVLLYVAFVYYPYGRGLKRSLWFAVGLVSTGLTLLTVTWILLPAWPTEFVETLRSYRDFAGTTGVEAVLGAGGPAWGVSGILLLFWAGMVGYTAHIRHDPDVHYLNISTALVLQVLIFPSHLYNIIFAVPLMVIGLRYIVYETARSPALRWLVCILLSLGLYFALLYWFGILSEGMSGAIQNLVNGVRGVAPGRIVYAAPVFFLLAIVLASVRIFEGQKEGNVTG